MKRRLFSLGSMLMIGIITYMIFFINQDTTFSKESNQLIQIHTEKKHSLNKKDIVKEAVLIDAPHVQQLPELPRGCEVTTLSMLLQYAGAEADKMKLASEIPKVPYKSNGLHGDPRKGFVGNMYDYTELGLSVYAGPVSSLGNKYLPGKIKNISGQPFNRIKRSLSVNKPVWVILSSNYDLVKPEFWETWQTKRGSIQITKKIHSVLVTGYDNQYVYFNDPLYHKKNRKISIEKFLIAWKQFGNQAITLK